MSHQALPLITSILHTAAHMIGATISVHQEWPTLGKITFANGQSRYFKQSTFDINPQAASVIIKDKDFADYFLRQHGYPTIPNSKTFYSPSYAQKIRVTARSTEDALSYADQIGYPVIVKPNNGSQGDKVTMAADQSQLLTALEDIFSTYDIALIQSVVHGLDYRLVVLDERIELAYQRIPLTVCGDGRSSVAKLLQMHLDELRQQGRKIHLSPEDRRIATKLNAQGLTMEFVPQSGQQVQMLDNANLSTGGTMVDVINLHPLWEQIITKMVKDAGIRYCGVDIITSTSIEHEPLTWWVIELNGSPGMSHYANFGQVSYQKVEKLYTKLLLAMESDCQSLEIDNQIEMLPADGWQSLI